MTSYAPRLPQTLPMPEGLLAWTRNQGPDMWHEIASGIDFTAPQATIDLLMAAQWIIRQAGCGRSTALLLLARLVTAGLHQDGPAHLAPEAARVMVRHLHRRLAEGRFAEPGFALTPAQSVLIDALFGPMGALPLPDAQRRAGTRPACPPYAFLGWHPVDAQPVFSRLAA